MHKSILRIVTRKSPLALWQAEHVRDRLEQFHPGLRVELIGVQTTGDKILDSPLAKIGGKGLFVKELELTMLRGDADLAVHSMKDVPVELPSDLRIAAILEREDPRDALLTLAFETIVDVPNAARIGTSSLRRQCQLRALRPDLQLLELRGNVGTRLQKLLDGHFDGIVLAAAGVKRLGLDQHVRQYLQTDLMLPAIGQGAIGIECRRDDTRTQELIQPLNDPDTWTRVIAERAFNERLNGGCQVPIAGHAIINDDDTVLLRGLVCNMEGTRLVRGTISAPRAEAEQMGFELANDLLKRGAAEILQGMMTDGN